MSYDTIISCEDDVEHMIIWLDLTFENPYDYINMKKAFSSNLDPKSTNLVQLDDKDYYELIRNIDLTYENFEGVRFLLAVFTNAEDCFRCFEQNQDKHILFITSGSMGRVVVPIILDRFRYVFTDPETNEPYSSIYVLCHNIELQMGLALEYSDYIQIFNFDTDLLVRMIRDIANYYVTRSKRLLAEDPPNSIKAKHRLYWARELYRRYSNMQHVSLRSEFNEVDELLKSIHDESNSSSTFVNDEE